MATNNIEKLYELAGIEKYYLYTVKHLGKIHIAPLEGILENKHLFERNKKSKVKNTYINRVKKVFPSFTDTKQLELIKWLIIEGYIEDMLTVQISEENFEACLADTFNELWQDLTETEQEEIRKILKG